MSDFFTARLEEPTDSALPPGMTLENVVVLKDRNNPERMSVRFVIGAETPDKAFAFARDPVLIDEGMSMVRKEGLAAPGVNASAIPVPCNQKGETIANPMGTIDPNVQQRYFYSITYDYLGED